MKTCQGGIIYIYMQCKVPMIIKKRIKAHSATKCNKSEQKVCDVCMHTQIYQRTNNTECNKMLPHDLLFIIIIIMNGHDKQTTMREYHSYSRCMHR